MKRWVAILCAGLIVATAWGYRMQTAHDGQAKALSTATSVALDSLRPIGASKPGIANNYSSVAVVTHGSLTSNDGKRVDHGIMFSLVPGHSGASSYASITFPLAKRFARLSTLVLASGGSGTAPPDLEIQDVSSQNRPARVLYSGQVSPGGDLSVVTVVRGVSGLQISASTSFDCVCDSAATVLVVGLLTRP